MIMGNGKVSIYDENGKFVTTLFYDLKSDPNNLVQPNVTIKRQLLKSFAYEKDKTYKLNYTNGPLAGRNFTGKLSFGGQGCFMEDIRSCRIIPQKTTKAHDVALIKTSPISITDCSLQLTYKNNKVDKNGFDTDFMEATYNTLNKKIAPKIIRKGKAYRKYGTFAPIPNKSPCLRDTWMLQNGYCEHMRDGLLFREQGNFRANNERLEKGTRYVASANNKKPFIALGEFKNDNAVSLKSGAIYTSNGVTWLSGCIGGGYNYGTNKREVCVVEFTNGHQQLCFHDNNILCKADEPNTRLTSSFHLRRIFFPSLGKNGLVKNYPNTAGIQNGIVDKNLFAPNNNNNINNNNNFPNNNNNNNNNNNIFNANNNNNNNNPFNNNNINNNNNNNIFNANNNNNNINLKPNFLPFNNQNFLGDNNDDLDDSYSGDSDDTVIDNNFAGGNLVNIINPLNPQLLKAKNNFGNNNNNINNNNPFNNNNNNNNNVNNNNNFPNNNNNNFLNNNNNIFNANNNNNNNLNDDDVGDDDNDHANNINNNNYNANDLKGNNNNNNINNNIPPLNAGNNMGQPNPFAAGPDPFMNNNNNNNNLFGNNNMGGMIQFPPKNDDNNDDDDSVIDNNDDGYQDNNHGAAAGAAVANVNANNNNNLFGANNNNNLFGANNNNNNNNLNDDNNNIFGAGNNNNQFNNNNNNDNNNNDLNNNDDDNSPSPANLGGRKNQNNIYKPKPNYDPTKKKNPDETDNSQKYGLPIRTKSTDLTDDPLTNPESNTPEKTGGAGSGSGNEPPETKVPNNKNKNNNKNNNQNNSNKFSNFPTIISAGGGIIGVAAITIGSLEGANIIKVFGNKNVAIVVALTGVAITGLAVYFLIDNEKKRKNITSKTSQTKNEKGQQK